MTPPTTGSYALAIMAASSLASSVSNLSVGIVCAAIILLFICIAFAISSQQPKAKATLFTMIATVVTVATLVLGAGNVALVLNSPTGGPVRWAADFQVWACGNQLDLRDPRGLLTDRVGSPVLFEKNDGRIHYNGTPTNLPQDVTLGTFMQTVGGNITSDSLIFPVNNDNGFIGTPTAPEQVEPYINSNDEGTYVRFLSGQTCGTEKAEVQAFAYHFNPADNTYSQSKIDDPANYEISHQQTVPPSDCIIMEFAPPKDRTDHLCQSYGQRDTERCTVFGVSPDKATSCDLREVKS